jgi:hypothetical protein
MEQWVDQRGSRRLCLCCRFRRQYAQGLWLRQEPLKALSSAMVTCRSGGVF